MRPISRTTLPLLALLALAGCEPDATGDGESHPAAPAVDESSPATPADEPAASTPSVPSSERYLPPAATMAVGARMQIEVAVVDAQPEQATVAPPERFTVQLDGDHVTVAALAAGDGLLRVTYTDGTSGQIALSAATPDDAVVTLASWVEEETPAVLHAGASVAFNAALRSAAAGELVGWGAPQWTADPPGIVSLFPDASTTFVDVRAGDVAGIVRITPGWGEGVVLEVAPGAPVATLDVVLPEDGDQLVAGSVALLRLHPRDAAGRLIALSAQEIPAVPSCDTGLFDFTSPTTQTLQAALGPFGLALRPVCPGSGILTVTLGDVHTELAVEVTGSPVEGASCE